MIKSDSEISCARRSLVTEQRERAGEEAQYHRSWRKQLRFGITMKGDH